MKTQREIENMVQDLQWQIKSHCKQLDSITSGSILWQEAYKELVKLEAKYEVLQEVLK